MAIDRTKKWRCQWQGANGWANMLEIIPAGDVLNGTDLTVTNFSRAAFEMDFAEFGFDDLPIGMPKMPAASFSFVWANLPSGLQELLKTPQYTLAGWHGDVTTTTLFTYWNDEGTNTLILQYIGAQANTLGNTFDMSDTDVVDTCKIETFDLLKTIFDTTKPNIVFRADDTTNYVDTPSLATLNSISRHLVDFSDDHRFKLDVLPNVTAFTASLGLNNFLYYSIKKFADTFVAWMEEYLGLWTRAGLITYRPTITQTGYPDTSLTFYKQTKTDAHTKGTALDETNTLILGHVTQFNAGNYNSLGGFFSNDKEGVADFDSLGSFIAALCENFVCKFIAKPTTCVNGVSGDTLLTYNFWWLKPLENVTSPVTYTPNITADRYSISTAEKVFLVCESEIPNMAGDNINQNRVSITVSDKSDPWSSQMILHNCPTIALEGNKTPANMNLDPYNKYTIKISPRKLYYSETGADYQVYKVHESVVINDGINTKTLDSPTAFQNENWFDDVLSGWVINTQQTQCLPQAVAEYITTYWSKHDQCLREFPCEMVTGEITPSFVGDYAVLPAVTAVGANNNSVLLSAKPDWDKGTIDCKYLSLGA